MVRVEIQAALTGQQLSLDVEKDCLVATLKDKVQAHWDIPSICQVLLSEGEALEKLQLPEFADGSIVRLDLVVSLRRIYSTLEDGLTCRGFVSQRKCALEALLVSKCKADDDLIELLMSQLKCRNGTIRCLVLRCIAEVVNPCDWPAQRAQSFVYRLCEHGDFEMQRKVRRQIAITLAALFSKDTLFSLLNLENTWWLRRHCWQLSKGRGDEDVIQNVVPLLQVPPPRDLAISVCLLRAKRGDARVIAALTAILRTEPTEEAIQAATALSVLACKSDDLALPELLLAFRGAFHGSVRKKELEKSLLGAICAIANRGDARAVQCVLDYMEDAKYDEHVISSLSMRSYRLLKQLLWLVELFSQVAPRTDMSRQIVLDRRSEILMHFNEYPIGKNVDEFMSNKCSWLSTSGEPQTYWS